MDELSEAERDRLADEEAAMEAMIEDDENAAADDEYEAAESESDDEVDAASEPPVLKKVTMVQSLPHD